jgi:hypothetical protein
MGDHPRTASIKIVRGGTWVAERGIFYVQPVSVAKKLVCFNSDFSRCRKVNEPEEYFCLEMQTTYEGNGFAGTRNREETL